MLSERTKICIKKKRFYSFLSWFLCFGIGIALFIYGFATKWNGGESSEVKQHIKALLIIGAIAVFPTVIMAIIAKDKIKPTLRMINIILAAYLVANWFMFLIGTFMLLDTYLVQNLIEKYKTAIIANKEIDKRDELNI